MQTSVVESILMAATKGANILVSWHRPCKVKKTCTDTITKAVDAVGRVGIDYNNQKAVIEKRANGELPEQEKPIWHGKGEWVKFPFLFRHVDTNQHYIRLYSGTGTAPSKVQFFRNGEKVRIEEISDVLLASEKNSEKGDCFCCKVEDMTNISWKPAKEIETPTVEVEIDAPEKVKEMTTEPA